jgi:predicted nucleotidyltransferase
MERRMTVLAAYPTAAHERAASAITEFFADRDETDAVLLTNSCARGRATPDSCLDLQVVVRPDAVARLDAEFRRFAADSAEIAELARAGRFSDLHLDVSDGIITLAPIEEEGIPWSEVSIGTFFVYSVPLHVNGDRYERLRREWLPFYDDALRLERLRAARWFVLDNNIARIPWYVGRELYFQAFDRFYRAFQGFLLGLHLARRTYPIAYNKWIREQVVENLGLPELYEQLPRLFELERFESGALEKRAAELATLVEEYLVESC